MWVTPNSLPEGDVQYLMPMPIDRMTTFPGSGLPFPSADIAYNPAQSGVCTYSGGRYVIEGAHPPNVYVGEDGVTREPEAILTYRSLGREVREAVSVNGVTRIRYRNIVSHPARTGPSYYDARNLPVRSQEAILRDSGYPSVQAVQAAPSRGLFSDWFSSSTTSKEDASFGWGLRPRV